MLKSYFGFDDDKIVHIIIKTNFAVDSARDDEHNLYEYTVKFIKNIFDSCRAKCIRTVKYFNWISNDIGTFSSKLQIQSNRN